MASSNVKFLTNKPNIMKINIDCPITNLIITPLTCSSFIMELIKLLVYEKLQIPYPYSWLKSTVNRRKKSEQLNNENNIKIGNIDRCYKSALTALDFLDNLSTQLHKEFKNCTVCEILLCFGVNIATPTETYSIVLPNMLNGHTDTNHLSEMNKTVHKIMRNIILSDEWLQVTKSSIPPTNMHVLIKKSNNNGLVENEKSDYFLPKDQYRIPTYTRLVNINLKYTLTEEHKCCSNLEIFQDKSVNRDKNVNSCYVEQEVLENNGIEQAQWFQAKYFLKGYKDTFIDSRSVSNLW